MQIIIKTLSGRKQTFNFECDQKVLAVKQALQEKEGELESHLEVQQLAIFHRIPF